MKDETLRHPTHERQQHRSRATPEERAGGCLSKTAPCRLGERGRMALDAVLRGTVGGGLRWLAERDQRASFAPRGTKSGYYHLNENTRHLRHMALNGHKKAADGEACRWVWCAGVTSGLHSTRRQRGCRQKRHLHLYNNQTKIYDFPLFGLRLELPTLHPSPALKACDAQGQFSAT